VWQNLQDLSSELDFENNEQFRDNLLKVIGCATNDKVSCTLDPAFQAKIIALTTFFCV
jgi:hypothetical protein